MGQVIWAPAALDDLDAICAFVSRDSADQAAFFVTRVMEATDRLADFPHSGRVIPEIAKPSCREVFVGFYRIMYRIEGDTVWITSVVHGARNWEAK